MRLNVVGFLFLLRLGLLAAPVEDLRLSNAEGGWDAMYKEEIGPLAGFDSLPIPPIHFIYASPFKMTLRTLLRLGWHRWWQV